MSPEGQEIAMLRSEIFELQNQARSTSRLQKRACMVLPEGATIAEVLREKEARLQELLKARDQRARGQALANLPRRSA